MKAEHSLVPVTETGGIINPATGQEVTVESADDVILDLLEFLTEAHSRIKQIEGTFGAILIERADKRKKWTFAEGRASVPSPDAGGSWDPVMLEDVLRTMVRRNRIDQEAADACLHQPPLPDVEVRVRAVQAVMKGANKADKARLESCWKRKTGARRLKLR